MVETRNQRKKRKINPDSPWFFADYSEEDSIEEGEKATKFAAKQSGFNQFLLTQRSKKAKNSKKSKKSGGYKSRKGITRRKKR